MNYLKVGIELADYLEPLGEAERGRLFTAMLRYARDGAAPALTGEERFLWPVAKAMLDRAARQAARRRALRQIGRASCRERV